MNCFNIPLIIYAGIDCEGRNISSGIIIVNDETVETHEWYLEKYFELHKNIPQVLVTDRDLALSKETNVFGDLLSLPFILREVDQLFIFLLCTISCTKLNLN